MKNLWQTNKKFVIITLVFILIATNLVGLTFANELRSEENVDMVTEIPPEQPQIPEEKEISVSGAVYNSSNISVSGAVYMQDEITRIKARAEENRKKRLNPKDQFNYTKQDIEDLLLGGATIEDIYRSDEIGNEWLTDPKELVHQKRQQSDLTWDDIETNIKKDKEQKLNELLKKHPRVERLLTAQQMNTAEKLAVLEATVQLGENTLNQFVKKYQSQGLNGIQQTDDIKPDAELELELDSDVEPRPGIDDPVSVPDSVYNEIQDGQVKRQ